MKNTFTYILYFIILLAAFVGLKFLSELSYQMTKSDPVWELSWADEFDKDGKPDDEKWKYDIGDGCPLCGWGNNELQYYTDSTTNVFVKDGFLNIQVLKDSVGTKPYSSTRIKSKKDIKYGKIEVRVKNPSKKGTWPAVWMLPTENKFGIWPRSGEIDIMEHVGYNPDSIFGTVHTEAYNHTKSTQKSGSKAVMNNESNFHNYSVEWTPDYIDFLIDEEKYFTFTNENLGSEEWPFDQSFHLIMNVAVGGNWGGREGLADDISGEIMQIDYVRVYKDASPQKLF